MALDSFFLDKTILITGGCGTVGRELVRQLIRSSPKEIRVFDNSEDGIFQIESAYKDKSELAASIGDIRDAQRIKDVANGVDIVFHAAALKHVQICERSPADAVMTNVMGTQNVIDAAIHNNVPVCIFTSTDKAVNPTNVMGTSKLMGERLFTTANNYSRSHLPVFASTRFGNVLASRGSVLTVFFDQILKGGPLTVTDPMMTRFVMSVEESVRLIRAAARLAKGGEVFVPKMNVIRLKEFAEAFKELVCAWIGKNPKEIPVEIVGPRLGERRFEELMTLEESYRALELEDLYTILPPPGSLRNRLEFRYKGAVKDYQETGFNTEMLSFLSAEETKRFLEGLDVIKHLRDRTAQGLSC